MENNKNIGIVIFFNAKKGFGFIKRNDDKTDIFVHYSDINMEGYKVLMAGDLVSFEENYNFKNKLKASNVILIERNHDKSKK